jgi:thiol-disulfide isomerase/thioredoxin
VTEKKNSSKTLIWVVVGLVAVVGAFWAALSSAGDDPRNLYENAAFGPIDLAGDGIGPFLGHGGFDPSDAAFGLTAPFITGDDYDVNVLTIGNDGKPKILVFLAHWCPHCQAELPRLSARFAGATSEDGVDFYSIATSTNSTRANFPPAPWLVNSGVVFPNIMNNVAQDVAAAYGLSAFPFWVAVGADGKIIGRASGQFSADQITEFVSIANGS